MYILAANVGGCCVNEAEQKSEASEPVISPEESTQQPLEAESELEAHVDAQAEALRAAQEESARLKDQLLRTAADFDNYRKRSRRDVEEANRKGLERALIEVLPVADNLERAIQAATQSPESAAILEGVRMVLKLTEDALARLGTERIVSVGQPFDPGLHEAVQQVESEEPAGTVVIEMVPGYRLGGKLLRPAMVAVAQAKPKVSAQAADEPSA